MHVLTVLRTAVAKHTVIFCLWQDAARPFSFQSTDIFYYLLGLDMGADQEHRLHDHNGDTHVNAHDFSAVDFAKKMQYYN